MYKTSIFTLFMTLCLMASAQERGVVAYSVNYMRQEPDYESALVNQSLMGTVVEILEQSGYWLKVRTDEPYEGWVTEEGVARLSSEALKEYLSTPKYICTARYSFIYSEPSAASDQLSDLVQGDIVRKGPCRRLPRRFAPRNDIDGDTYSRHSERSEDRLQRARAESLLSAERWQTDGRRSRTNLKKRQCYRGWTSVITARGEQGWVLKRDVQDLSEWISSRELTAENVIRTAKTFLGVPYLWGGASAKGFDCSGLVQYCWYLCGGKVPRDAGPQYFAGEDIPLSFENLRPADLLFFGKAATEDEPLRITHVGIYIGEGKFIHCSQSVKISSLLPDRPDTYYRQPIKACRLIP